jgi:hypothetical protein
MLLMRRRLSVLVAMAVMVATMFVVAGPVASAADALDKGDGKNSGWGDGNGGGKNHPKKNKGGGGDPGPGGGGV